MPVQPDSTRCARPLQRCRAMPQPDRVEASVVICTYNRSALLRTTLESLRQLRTSRSWELLVIDNNSTDDTRTVVSSFGAHAPIPVHYVFEPRQGKSFALNTGMSRAAGDIIAFTDDDVVVEPEWLDTACDGLDREPEIDYTGGPVRPLWAGIPPVWLDQHRSDLWGTLAILDYGDDSFIFEERRKVPLGVNMAVRRSLVGRIGGFHPELGRRGKSLLGQEQAEFLARARAEGVRGRYLPGMKLAHYVPAERLTRRYFTRWWFWKGVSRARVDAMHQCTELGLDLRQVPYVAGVPRYVWGQVPRSLADTVRAVASGDRRAAMRHAMRIAYSFGYIRACWSGSRIGPMPAVPLASQPTLMSQ